MQAPKFWYQSPSWKQKICCVLSICYKALTFLHRFFQRRKKAPVPVICIGNIVVGGSGKTPLAIALGKILSSHCSVAFLSRGYGGRLRGPVLVDISKHLSTDVGDEPLLLAQQSMTIVSNARYDGAVFAYKNGAECVVMDDGLQNESIAKTCSVLVLNGEQGIGNGSILPAGPLRESLADGMRKVGAVFFYGPDKHDLLPRLEAYKKPIFSVALVPDCSDLAQINQLRVFAFCGLGYPDKFYQCLKAHDVDVVGTRSYPDHFAYGKSHIKELLDEATKLGAQLVTTQKDLLRVPFAYHKHIMVLKVKAQFLDPDAVKEFVLQKYNSL